MIKLKGTERHAVGNWIEKNRAMIEERPLTRRMLQDHLAIAFPSITFKASHIVSLQEFTTLKLDVKKKTERKPEAAPEAAPEPGAILLPAVQNEPSPRWDLVQAQIRVLAQTVCIIRISQGGNPGPILNDLADGIFQTVETLDGFGRAADGTLFKS